MHLAPVGLERLQLVLVGRLGAVQCGLIRLQRRLALRLRVAQRHLRGVPGHLGADDIGLRRRHGRVGAVLARGQALLGRVEAGLRRAHLGLRERNLLGRCARLQLRQRGLLLGQAGLRLVDGGLQVGRVLAGDDLAGGDLLANADVDLAELATALEAERHARRVGDRAGRRHGHAQRALADG